MTPKQNIPTQVRKVLRWKVEQSSHNWHGISECWVINYRCLSLEKPENHAASKTLSFYLVDIDIKRRWMDGILVEEWVRELDRKFLSEGRNVAILIDNCPAHPHIENLKAIKLFFLPPNTTSTTQPTDQGVIRSLKAKHRINVVRKIIRSLEKNKTLPKISLLHGRQMLVSAWNAFTTETIVNCFRKVGIYVENQVAAIVEEDDPFKDLQDGIDALRNVHPDHILEDINAASLVHVDAEVSAVQPPPTDAEILADFLETDNISDDELVDDSVEDVTMEYPGKNELLHALELSQKFSLFAADGDTVQSNCFKLERDIDNHFIRQGKKQTIIKDFFKV